jgi:hypothetical protein
MIGRNDPCPCGSGRKYKKCCITLSIVARSASTIRPLINKSRIPAEKLNDPRLAKVEEEFCADLANPKTRLRSCLHEAAHMIYAGRAGYEASLKPLEIEYDPDTDTFGGGLCTHMESDGERDFNLDDEARIAVAGGVVVRRLIAGNDDYCGDDHDFNSFRSELQESIIESVGEAKWEDLFEYIWATATVDVEKDLESPAFRRELWQRAHQLNTYLETLWAVPRTEAA